MERQKNEVWEWTKALLIAAGLAAIIRFFLFSPIVVDGSSMVPTLHNGERMIMNKISYQFKEPDRFDIVVFHAPGNKDYIKRVIGLPGDEIQYKDDVLYINGEAYDEPYLDEYKKEYPGTHYTKDFSLEEVINQSTVPEGHIFVLGDNRPVSQDSRTIGSVNIEEIVGNTSIVFWPVGNVRNVE
ncbi:signal peptidase I [Bacillus sp. 2205SS5-2]|uniref:signal peptidase I n=1 Tax=Bacillus sp. 2205SS5-2 TaxID=3109031 RepID=UPI00300714CB